MKTGRKLRKVPSVLVVARTNRSEPGSTSEAVVDDSCWEQPFHPAIGHEYTGLEAVSAALGGSSATRNMTRATNGILVDVNVWLLKSTVTDY
jgi:hypothetical protein